MPLVRVPMVPELLLELADEATGLWDATGGGYRSDTPPPFWAFAWPGGVALARYLLDHPEAVAGRSAVDLGTGSGLVAIAAARAGAHPVLAVDTDPVALTAVARNAAANEVEVATGTAPVPADVVLAGDVFYSGPVADRMLKHLRACRATVLVGDPDRDFLPKRLFEELAVYDVPVRPALEDQRHKRTSIWRLR